MCDGVFIVAINMKMLLTELVVMQCVISGVELGSDLLCFFKQNEDGTCPVCVSHVHSAVHYKLNVCYFCQRTPCFLERWM